MKADNDVYSETFESKMDSFFTSAERIKFRSLGEEIRLDAMVDEIVRGTIPVEIEQEIPASDSVEDTSEEDDELLTKYGETDE